MPAHNSLKLVVNGCSPGTGNLGVTALLYSLLAGLHEREPMARVAVIGLGNSRKSIRPFGEFGPIYNVLPLNHSRRFYSPRSTSNYTLWNSIGIPMTRISRIVQAADALLDISAGDSFTDLYGMHRFDSICFLKEVAIAREIPLVLLPQTYGPFQRRSTEERAAAILKQAESVWSRDAASAAVANELLKKHTGGMDRAPLHRQGVDLAFGLPIDHPAESEATARFLNQRARAECLVGLNVSGLIYNHPESARATFSLQANYQIVVTNIVMRLLAHDEVEVMLVPHVIAKPGSHESDSEACRHVRSNLPPSLRHRVSIAPECTDPREIKWYISQCDWFCGTRMHSTIAALSAGVPAASIAYSMKTRGVFETCGVAEEVIDPRLLDTQEVIHQVYQCWIRRESIRDVLRSTIPNVMEQSRTQLDAIVHRIRNPARPTKQLLDWN